MKLYSSGYHDGAVVEEWQCHVCGAIQTLIVQKR